jgi:general secretion pathway protein G
VPIPGQRPTDWNLSNMMNGRRDATRRRAAGFTLIEVMVVVVILGILAALVVPRIMDRPAEARQVKARQDIRALESALGLYKLDNYVYPTTDQGLEALVERPGGSPEPRNWKAGGYVRRLPSDPWGNPYLYLNPGSHGDFDLYTLGADGQPGGEGENADIANWTLE